MPYTAHCVSHTHTHTHTHTHHTHTHTHHTHTHTHTSDELDSMMYQTAGHEGIYLYAEAMELPLYTATTRGRAECMDLQYESREGDEVEDLHCLLRRVKVSMQIDRQGGMTGVPLLSGGGGH